MFPDLLSSDIQPNNIDIEIIPEIKLSRSLRLELQKALQEEDDWVNIEEKTSIVKTDKNYVLFPNQWFYLVVACKKYAESLLEYWEFFDKEIRGNKELSLIIKNGDYLNEKFITIIPDELDRDRFVKFLQDESYRPGKALINGNTFRSTRDVFGSSMLKQMPVPDASTAYLGHIIYYLAKRPALYNKLLHEIELQISEKKNGMLLPRITKECAKQIIDTIYKLDKFDAINELFEINDKNIKINISKTGNLLPNGNFLRYLFARPSSDLYNGDSDKPRVFTTSEYKVSIGEEQIDCRLTTEWVDSDVVEGGNGNYLKALITIVNHYYKGNIEIRTEFGERYICFMKENFDIKELPETFQTDFARRYITSLLAKPFVILTGNSGTGKTRISKQFAEYLEWVSEEGKKNWLIVPVGADWTDNSKILGFYNPIADDGKGKYESTNIVKLIEEANKHKNIPYFIILDEMNLSHVERYFSDFLSHMETPDTNFVLDGYTGEDTHVGELEYPDNLFVIGTVNIDETTYMFSPKVLDRANVIEFKPNKESVLKLFGEVITSVPVHPANDGSAEAFLKLAKEIRTGKISIDEKAAPLFSMPEGEQFVSNISHVESVFSEIYEVVEKNDFEFAFRTVKEIRQYISASYELVADDEFDLDRILDEQLLQKVLPKIHGNRKEIGELLEELSSICDKYVFIKSKKKIEQMKGKLAKVQYASFI